MSQVKRKYIPATSSNSKNNEMCKFKNFVTDMLLEVVHANIYFRIPTLASAYAEVMFIEIRFAKRKVALFHAKYYQPGIAI